MNSKNDLNKRSESFRQGPLENAGSSGLSEISDFSGLWNMTVTSLQQFARRALGPPKTYGDSDTITAQESGPQPDFQPNVSWRLGSAIRVRVS